MKIYIQISMNDNIHNDSRKRYVKSCFHFAPNYYFVCNYIFIKKFNCKIFIIVAQRQLNHRALLGAFLLLSWYMLPCYMLLLFLIIVCHFFNIIFLFLRVFQQKLNHLFSLYIHASLVAKEDTELSAAFAQVPIRNQKQP